MMKESVAGVLSSRKIREGWMLKKRLYMLRGEMYTLKIK